MAQSSSMLREPTMDEILTSIREIIKENTAQSENLDEFHPSFNNALEKTENSAVNSVNPQQSAQRIKPENLAGQYEQNKSQPYQNASLPSKIDNQQTSQSFDTSRLIESLRKIEAEQNKRQQNNNNVNFDSQYNRMLDNANAINQTMESANRADMQNGQTYAYNKDENHVSPDEGAPYLHQQAMPIAKAKPEKYAEQEQSYKNNSAQLSVDDAMHALAARIGLAEKAIKTSVSPAQSYYQATNEEIVQNNIDNVQDESNNAAFTAAALQMQKMHENLPDDTVHKEEFVKQDIEMVNQQSQAASVLLKEHPIEPLKDENEQDHSDTTKSTTGSSSPLSSGFESAAEKALRPLINQWLEIQLPQLIEKIIREEMTNIFEKQLAALDINTSKK